MTASRTALEPRREHFQGVVGFGPLSIVVDYETGSPCLRQKPRLTISHGYDAACNTHRNNNGRQAIGDDRRRGPASEVDHPCIQHHSTCGSASAVPGVAYGAAETQLDMRGLKVLIETMGEKIDRSEPGTPGANASAGYPPPPPSTPSPRPKRKRTVPQTRH